MYACYAVLKVMPAEAKFELLQIADAAAKLQQSPGVCNVLMRINHRNPMTVFSRPENHRKRSWRQVIHSPRTRWLCHGVSRACVVIVQAAYLLLCIPEILLELKVWADHVRSCLLPVRCKALSQPQVVPPHLRHQVSKPLRTGDQVSMRTDKLCWHDAEELRKHQTKVTM